MNIPGMRRIDKYEEMLTNYDTKHMKQKWKKFKYPKFLLLALTFIIAYLIFLERDFVPFHEFLRQLGYLGTFLAGIMFAYGFTAAPAASLLLIFSQEQNLVLAGLIAGAGALLGDLLIFKLIRNTFSGELKKLSKKKSIKKLEGHFSSKVKKYVLLVLAGFIIASPLPDEIGVSMLAAATTISMRIFVVISYLLNTAGIFVILLLGKSI